MVNFFSILHPIWQFLGDHRFLLVTVTGALILKVFLLSIFVLRGTRKSKLTFPLIILLLVLVSGMIEDLAWILKLSHSIFFPSSDYKFILFFIRCAWAFYAIKFQALGLFIENLSEKKSRLKVHQIPFILISTFFFVYFIISAFLQFNSIIRNSSEIRIMEIDAAYTLIPLMLTSLFITLWKLRATKTPRIIRKQLKILIKFLVAPTLALEIIQMYPFVFMTSPTNNSSVVGLSTIALTLAIYYSLRKVMGLRFLNLYKHVRATKGYDFMKDFKGVLEQFSHVTSEPELSHITKNFFKDAFNIPLRRTHLYIRNNNTEKNSNHTMAATEETFVENFISSHNGDNSINTFLKKEKILITDELEFSNFYEKHFAKKKSTQFLSVINADLFLPVYDKDTLVAYIIIERYARAQKLGKNAEFYSNVDRDQMVVFAAYLGNIIHLLRNRNLNTLIAQEKELQEELYDKHQKINQYKESIRSFLRTNKQRKIGIIFYKNRRFTFGNKTAQDLVNVNINTHEGHPISRAIKKAAHQAILYKSQQTCFVQDSNNNKLVVSAIPNLEQNNVIITIYYPEISDILKKKVELLSDPTKWDYLLYLETTKSGKLIDQLIPGYGETLLNFKIDLLKIALSKKAILLDMPHEDLIPTVELLHHISLREKLHVLTIKSKSENFDLAIKLFGINPIFGLNKDNKEPLLKTLNGTGTLFIQNIHFFDIKTQEYLAEFLKYGMYKTFKSDKKTSSNIRIICSTNKNLQEMVNEETFSKELFGELNKTQLVMPSLGTLSEDEIKNLAVGFSKQALEAKEFQNLLELTDTEKRKIAHARPSSLQELKNRVQKLLSKKTRKSDLYEETKFDPAFSISDPELIEATRLGKHALKDPKIMAMLWNKFKNQNKIATLLGVNRSSVNRRCKDYKIIP